MVIAFPTFLILIGGMTPSIVSFMTERRAGKNASRCMATLNLTGVAPVLFKLWNQGHRVNVALDLLADPVNWLLMLGPAVVALGMLSFLPTVAGTVLQMQARQRLAALKIRQEKLVEEWGADVMGEDS
jgi:hypothetical protein